METASFHVYGYPVPKGSHRYVGNGRTIPQGNPDAINAWRTDCKAAARQAMGERAPFAGAIRLSVDITLPYPRSSVRKYQMGWLPHIKTPDADKLIRSICDHLTGIVWRDDSQVCFLHMSKSYAWDDQPGAWIEAQEMSDEWLRSYAHNRSLLRRAIAEVEPLL